MTKEYERTCLFPRLRFYSVPMPESKLDKAARIMDLEVRVVYLLVRQSEWLVLNHISSWTNGPTDMLVEITGHD